MFMMLVAAAGLTCAQLPGVDGDIADLERAALADLVESEPDCGKAHLALGRLTYENETISESINHLEAAAERMAPDSELQRMIGEAYLARAGMESSLGDAGDGESHLRKALEIDPENLDARESLAGFLAGAPWIAGGDMDEADEHAEFIRARDPERGVMVLARNRLADDETGEAVAILEKGLKENPEWESLAVPLGIGYQNLEQFDNAFEVFARYADRPEPDPMVVYQLGRTAALSGNHLAQGRAAMKQYIEMKRADDSLPIPLAAAWWRLGMIDQKSENIDVARTSYEKALALEPEYAPAREALEKLD